MLLFPKLRSLRLQLDHALGLVSIADTLRPLTALTTLEIMRAFTAAVYQPMFGAPLSLTALTATHAILMP